MTYYLIDGEYYVSFAGRKLVRWNLRLIPSTATITEVTPK